MSSIFLVNEITNYKKLWLSGTKNFEKCKYLLNEEIKYLNIRDIKIDTITFYYTETFKEYDELLVKFKQAENNVAAYEELDNIQQELKKLEELELKVEQDLNEIKE
jgi:uncharacterized Fe-S cluster-containing protein